MKDKDFKRIFKAYRNEIPDDGFTQKLKNHLLPRPSFLPQILMSICTMTGITLTTAFLDIKVIIGHISEFGLSISNLQLPSLVSVMTYLIVLLCFVMIGYTIATTD